MMRTSRLRQTGLRLLAATGGLLLAVLPAPAQDFSDEQVLVYLNLGLDNYALFMCGDGQPCAPATAEEKADPPVTIAETRAILGQGIVSAVAEYCGLDWQRRSFLPMMAYFRDEQGKSARQMALIGGIHGIIQGQFADVLAGQGPCSDKMLRGVEQRLGPA